ncbi:hypothetical protein NDU88_008085 [Pleurodeles waltl]|uniref:Uncharacterized protein n=1 Tax=Pleurodeles waltl TaxID=8319 RepID=A0AAV7QQQ0_PLEWA|nr:hypothetical protein NDU88_008085 [Pleurodeles waltl]
MCGTTGLSFRISLEQGKLVKQSWRLVLDLVPAHRRVPGGVAVIGEEFCPQFPWPLLAFQCPNKSSTGAKPVDALAAAHTSIPSQVASKSPSVTPTQSAVNTATPLVSNVVPEIIKVPGKDNSAKEGTTDALLSRPGKLAAHVSAEVKEKIWKGEFVVIFSLIRAKRREVDIKDKEAKSPSSGDKKPKVEENITNWLFGVNVFMSVLLEKKPDLGISLIYYANKILKAQHTYGGSAWLEYDRDFRWTKVEDPSIGWDQTEVNVWLECVYNKVPWRQPFRTQYSALEPALSDLRLDPIFMGIDPARGPASRFSVTIRPLSYSQGSCWLRAPYSRAGCVLPLRG